MGVGGSKGSGSTISEAGISGVSVLRCGAALKILSPSLRYRKSAIRLADHWNFHLIFRRCQAFMLVLMPLAHSSRGSALMVRRLRPTHLHIWKVFVHAVGADAMAEIQRAVLHQEPFNR